MIESGTLTPGIAAELFGLPEGTALRMERPDAALEPFFSDYHALDSVMPPGEVQAAYMLPSWPAVRFILAPRPIVVSIGDAVYDPMPVAGLYGTSSRALLWTNGGGVTIGASVTPLGWARLFAQPASRFRDRVVPLDEVMPRALVAEAVERLRASDMACDVKPILDSVLSRAIGPPTRYDADIAAIVALLADPATVDLTSAAGRFAIEPVRLRRLSNRFFGFPPKTLLMRTRFLRSFLKMLMVQGGNDGPVDYSLIDDSYFDVSHFLRDSDRFLGMTPRRFLALENDYLRAAVRARQLVFAAPLPVFDPPLRAVSEDPRPRTPPHARRS
jgi:hypothetical protein